MKATLRKCPACGQRKLFRADNKTCGCLSLRGVDPKRVAPQLVHLRKQNEQLSRQVFRLLTLLGSQKEMAKLVADSVEAAQPVPRVPYQRSARTSSPITPVLMLSDLHIGEFIDALQTEGFGRYNCRRRRTA